MNSMIPDMTEIMPDFDTLMPDINELMPDINEFMPDMASFTPPSLADLPVGSLFALPNMMLMIKIPLTDLTTPVHDAISNFSID